jgi:hypothetical protein
MLYLDTLLSRFQSKIRLELKNSGKTFFRNIELKITNNTAGAII